MARPRARTGAARALGRAGSAPAGRLSRHVACERPGACQRVQDWRLWLLLNLPGRLEELGMLASALVCSNQDKEPVTTATVTTDHSIFVILCLQRSQQC
jgi:hypothetical protein